MSRINPEVTVAMIVAAALPDDKTTFELAGITSVAKDLGGSGIDLGDWGIYETGKGWFSSVVEETVGNYVRFGFATQRNPLQLTPYGIEALKKIVVRAEKENPQELPALQRKIAQLLEKTKIPVSG